MADWGTESPKGCGVGCLPWVLGFFLAVGVWVAIAAISSDDEGSEDGDPGVAAPVDAAPTEEEIRACIADIRASASELEDLAEPGADPDEVSDEELRQICLDTVLSGPPLEGPSDDSSVGPVSEECDAAMLTAARELDLERSLVLLHESLSACSSVNEWLSALRKHPAAMGLADSSLVGFTDVQINC